MGYPLAKKSNASFAFRLIQDLERNREYQQNKKAQQLQKFTQDSELEKIDNVRDSDEYSEYARPIVEEMGQIASNRNFMYDEKLTKRYNELDDQLENNDIVRRAKDFNKFKTDLYNYVGQVPGAAQDPFVLKQFDYLEQYKNGTFDGDDDPRLPGSVMAVDHGGTKVPVFTAPPQGDIYGKLTAHAADILRTDIKTSADGIISYNYSVNADKLDKHIHILLSDPNSESQLREMMKKEEMTMAQEPVKEGEKPRPVYDTVYQYTHALLNTLANDAGDKYIRQSSRTPDPGNNNFGNTPYYKFFSEQPNNPYDPASEAFIPRDENDRYTGEFYYFLGQGGNITGNIANTIPNAVIEPALSYQTVPGAVGKVGKVNVIIPLEDYSSDLQTKLTKLGVKASEVAPDRVGKFTQADLEGVLYRVAGEEGGIIDESKYTSGKFMQFEAHVQMSITPTTAQMYDGHFKNSPAKTGGYANQPSLEDAAEQAGMTLDQVDEYMRNNGLDPTNEDAKRTFINEMNNTE